jgi:hypothetical protein
MIDVSLRRGLPVRAWWTRAVRSAERTGVGGTLMLAAVVLRAYFLYRRDEPAATCPRMPVSHPRDIW